MGNLLWQQRNPENCNIFQSYRMRFHIKLMLPTYSFPCKVIHICDICSFYFATNTTSCRPANLTLIWYPPLIDHFVPEQDWLIIYGFTSRSIIFHLYGDITIAGEGLQNIGPCSALWAFEQEGIFIVPHLLWHRGLGFSGVIRPIQSSLTTHEGMWRIYSNPDPHGERVCEYMKYVPYVEKLFFKDPFYIKILVLCIHEHPKTKWSICGGEWLPDKCKNGWSTWSRVGSRIKGKMSITSLGNEYTSR
jgi:hypothetical protein